MIEIDPGIIDSAELMNRAFRTIGFRSPNIRAGTAESR